MDCSPAGSSICGISQARILEWVAISFSRGYSWPRDWSWNLKFQCPFFSSVSYIYPFLKFTEAHLVDQHVINPGEFLYACEKNVYSVLLFCDHYNVNLGVFVIVPEDSELCIHFFSFFFLYSVLRQWFPPFCFPDHLSVLLHHLLYWFLLVYFFVLVIILSISVCTLILLCFVKHFLPLLDLCFHSFPSIFDYLYYHGSEFR